jgi:hypothetical protein
MKHGLYVTMTFTGAHTSARNEFTVRRGTPGGTRFEGLALKPDASGAMKAKIRESTARYMQQKLNKQTGRHPELTNSRARGYESDI